MTTSGDELALPYHLLFPPKEDGTEETIAKSEDIAVIRLSRWERGAKVDCPSNFGPDELPDAATVQSMFGGGRYEAVCTANKQLGDIKAGGVIRRRTFHLPGEPRPLVVEIKPGTAAVAATPAAGAPAWAQTVAAIGLPTLILGVLEHWRETSLAEREAARAASAAAREEARMSREETRAFMTLLLEQAKGDKAQMMEVLKVTAAKVEASPVAAASPAGGDFLSQYKSFKLIEKEIKDGEGGLLDDLAELAKGAMEAMGIELPLAGLGKPGTGGAAPTSPLN
jgi:hypothetical protein